MDALGSHVGLSCSQDLPSAGRALPVVKYSMNILFKNFVDFMIGSVLFWFVGFGFMFGSDGAGFIGMPNFGDLSFYTNAAGLPY